MREMRQAVCKGSKGEGEITHKEEASEQSLSKDIKATLIHTEKLCWQFVFRQWLKPALPAFTVRPVCLPDTVGCVAIPK